MTAHEGIVLRAQSGQYAVLDAAGVVACRARRHLRRPEPEWPEYPVPGDVVEWRLLSGARAHRDGVIEAVRPRRSEISRDRFGRQHVVIANLDRLVVVIAVRDPALDRGLLDRLLAIAERNAIPALVCLHKIDRVDPATLDPVRTIYAAAGYEVLLTSVETGAGIDVLRERLRGTTSAFMGPSGAGKSRLISALQPGLAVRTGDVNPKTGQGRHTTTRVDLHRTDFGALIADTPGVRDFNQWRLPPRALRDLFPELRRIQDQCRFVACLHVREPECAVLAAVERGDIDPGRFKSYEAILGELVAAEAAQPPGGGRRRRATTVAHGRDGDQGGGRNHGGGGRRFQPADDEGMS
jgi:ribosome biogenesis GTPase